MRILRGIYEKFTPTKSSDAHDPTNARLGSSSRLRLPGPSSIFQFESSASLKTRVRRKKIPVDRRIENRAVEHHASLCTIGVGAFEVGRGHFCVIVGGSPSAVVLVILSW